MGKNLSAIFDAILRLNRLLFLSVLCVLIFVSSLTAQVAFIGGVNYTNERNNNLIENQKPRITYQWGASIRYYLLKNHPKISFQNELIFNQRGYNQVLDKDYFFHFDYISFPVLINYALTENFSINTGLEFSKLLSSNIKRYTETYNDFDIGLVLGFSCFEKKGISFYSRMTYGLLPLLDYYAIDKVGNFTGEIHDLKNICLSVGIKINIHNEKIRFYK
jgi:hypothetical protein